MDIKKVNIEIPTPFKGFESFNEFRSSVSDDFIKKQPSSVRQILEKVRDTMEKHKGALDEIEDVLLEYQQLVILYNPTVYVAQTKDVKTDIKYFTAKTFWPLKGGKRKEIKIYLGKAADYDNDTQSKRAKKEAALKMAQTIARRLREGSLEVK